MQWTASAGNPAHLHCSVSSMRCCRHDAPIAVQLRFSVKGNSAAMKSGFHILDAADLVKELDHSASREVLLVIDSEAGHELIAIRMQTCRVRVVCFSHSGLGVMARFCSSQAS